MDQLGGDLNSTPLHWATRFKFASGLFFLWFLYYPITNNFFLNDILKYMGELIKPIVIIINILLYCCPVLPALESKFIVQCP